MTPDTPTPATAVSEEQLARLERTSSNDTPDFITLDDYHVLNAALRELQQRRAQAQAATPPEPTTPTGSEPPKDACATCGWPERAHTNSGPPPSAVEDGGWHVCRYFKPQPPSVETPAPEAEPLSQEDIDWMNAPMGPVGSEPPAGAQPAQDVEALNSAVLDLDGMVNDHHQYPQLRMHNMQIERAIRVRDALARLQGGR
jgi:hypothetical protein